MPVQEELRLRSRALILLSCLSASRTSAKGYALIDSGAKGNFIDYGWAVAAGLQSEKLKRPIPLNLADSTPFRGGPITCYFTVNLRIHDHTERICFFPTTLGSSLVVLGIDWLRRHNL